MNSEDPVPDNSSARSVATVTPERLSFARRRVTCVTRDQYLFRSIARVNNIRHNSSGRSQSGINADFILAFLQRQHLVVGQAKSPVFPVVRSPIWNPVGIFGNCEKVRPQIAQGHGGMHGRAVVQYMQIAFLKIHYALSVRRSFIYASRMFHSFGTVQSKTAVPVGTSKIFSGIRF